MHCHAACLRPYTGRRSLCRVVVPRPGRVVIRENGPPENLVYETDFPTPKPADGQVLVKNEYTGINFIDT